MRLVVLDLVPALLSWEGRDASRPVVADQAEAALEAVFARFRIAGVTDSNRTATEIRDALDEAGLGGFFETLGTAADFGPRVTARVVRGIARAVRTTPDRLIVVTARPELAAALERGRIATLLVEPGSIAEVPEQLRRLTDEHPTP